MKPADQFLQEKHAEKNKLCAICRKPNTRFSRITCSEDCARILVLILIKPDLNDLPNHIIGNELLEPHTLVTPHTIDASQKRSRR